MDKEDVLCLLLDFKMALDDKSIFNCRAWTDKEIKVFVDERW